MNNLSRDKQIEIVAALTEGLGIRATARIIGVNRETVGTLALRIGRGCAELHDRMMVGIRVNRLELDEAWSYVAKKQRRVERHEIFAKGDQYVYVGMAGSQKAIVSYRVGKRDTDNTMASCASASSATRRSARTDGIPTSWQSAMLSVVALCMGRSSRHSA
jgi:hypothetical protein